jgi:hypothetical protein
MSQFITLSPAAVEKLCGLVRESHSVSEGINDEAVGTTSTFSSLKIQENMNRLENETDKKINQALKNTLGSEIEVNGIINSWFN